ncbi:alpha/beta fold hydrolase [Kribbella sp. DT2]|uniref:alpha/beta fold hydrolase n=1 Tax=Kribbella sp. DT2 TaxID=3393427 RepID=UPI003CF887E5
MSTIYYEDSGSGDAVLLLPGWAGSIAEFGSLLGELSDGFRVVAADLPGSGRSQPQPREYSVDFYAEDARAFLTLLDELGIGAAHLVGFSDGGEVALLMAALDPGRVLSVVTWGAAGRIVEPAAGPTFDQLEHLIGEPVAGRSFDEPERLIGEPVAGPSADQLERLTDAPVRELLPLAAYLAEAYGADTARAMARSWARALRGIADRGGDVARAHAASIRCPALLIAGSDDVFCPPYLVKEMADAIDGARYDEFEGAGHDLHRSAAGRFGGTLSDWLSRH